MGEGDRPTLASRRIQLGATQDWDGQDCRTRSHGHSLLRADSPLWTEKQEGASRWMSGPARLQEVDAAHRFSPNQLCHPCQGTLGGVWTSLFVTLGEWELLAPDEWRPGTLLPYRAQDAPHQSIIWPQMSVV